MGRDSTGSANASANLDEYKDAANRVATVVGAKASAMKSAATDWFTQFT
jgi:hypothetical protein